uniref:EMAP domain n=1 Tax=Candidatus Actinomarina minuta TaxID=1389454 RepID=S5DR98_9ACTN|nr:EMAP domain [Candidatus Actinomarina minuta]
MGQDNLINFASLDIRVGEILEVEDFPEALNPSYVIRINFGDAIGIKKTSAQVTNYTKESLVGRKCIAIINLGDKQIGPIISQCLILGSISRNNTVQLLSPEENVSIGDRIA